MANRFGKVNPPAPDSTNIIQKEKSGAQEGTSKFPTTLKNTAAILARSGMEHRVVGAMLGVDHASVTGYANGKHGVDAAVVEDRLNQVKDVALTKLMLSLGLITPDALSKSKVGELSTVASNLARIYGAVSPSHGKEALVNLTIYAPAMRDEKGYKVIDV